MATFPGARPPIRPRRLAPISGGQGSRQPNLQRLTGGVQAPMFRDKVIPRKPDEDTNGAMQKLTQQVASNIQKNQGARRGPLTQQDASSRRNALQMQEAYNRRRLRK